jgi:hypothetical protein
MTPIFPEPKPVVVAEGQSYRASPEEKVDYGLISSCLTIAAVSPDRTKNVVHMVLCPYGLQKTAETLFQEIVEDAGCSPTSSIKIAGHLDFWDPRSLGREDLSGTSIEEFFQKEFSAKCGIPEANIEFYPLKEDSTISISPSGEVVISPTRKS